MAVAACRQIDVGTCEAVPAIDRATLARIKWNGRDKCAPCTLGANLDALTFASSFSEFDRLEPAIFGLFTLLAAFWRILELFVAKERLLTSSPDKTLSAVYALYRRIGEVTRGIDRNWRG